MKLESIPILSIKEFKEVSELLINNNLIFFDENSGRLLVRRSKFEIAKKIYEESPASKIIYKFRSFLQYVNSHHDVAKCKICGKILQRPKSIECQDCHKFKSGEENPSYTGISEEDKKLKRKIYHAKRFQKLQEMKRIQCSEIYKNIQEEKEKQGEIKKPKRIKKDSGSKPKNSKDHKNPWDNPTYREKVIRSNMGKKRTEEFKEAQRQRAYKQFKNPGQRLIRSAAMKNAWATGKMKNSMAKPSSYNRSKKEKNLFINLATLLNAQYNDTSYFVIHYIENNESKWLYPDFIFNKIIIEYNGKYWHCMPDFYKDDFRLHTGKTAREIWDYDNHKKEIYMKEGYSVLTVWETFINPNKKDKNYISEKLNLILQKIKEIEKFQKENLTQGVFELK